MTGRNRTPAPVVHKNESATSIDINRFGVDGVMSRADCFTLLRGFYEPRGDTGKVHWISTGRAKVRPWTPRRAALN